MLSYPFVRVSIRKRKGMAGESALGLRIPVFTASLVLGECE